MNSKVSDIMIEPSESKNTNTFIKYNLHTTQFLFFCAETIPPLPLLNSDIFSVRR